MSVPGDAEEQIVQLLKNRGVRSKTAPIVAAVAPTAPHAAAAIAITAASPPPTTTMTSSAPLTSLVSAATSLLPQASASAAAAGAAATTWADIERYATHVQQLIREAKQRGFAPNADAHAALFNSASCLLKASHSLEPAASASAARSMATATGLSSGRLLIDDADRRRKLAAAADDDDGGAMVKRRVRKPPVSVPGQACAQCKRTDSPEWRKGPDGTHSLCNACGLRFARQQAKRQKTATTTTTATAATTTTAAVVDPIDDE